MARTGPSAPLRWNALTAIELIVLVQLIAVQLVIASSGVTLVWASLFEWFLAVAPKIALQIAAGVLLRWLYNLMRGRGRDYLRSVLTREWLTTSVRLTAATTVALYTYGYPKLLLPFIASGNYDGILWKIDRAIFFGLSPNVFFLNLFSASTLLRTIDWSYANVFFATMAVAFPIVVSLPHSRIRVAYVTGYLLLWMIGIWGYYLLPALGPCYAFPEVWQELRDHLPASRYWQRALLQNYRLVLEAKETGAFPSGINIAYGIAAFPSLHVAVQFYVALWMRHIYRPFALLWDLFTALIFIGSIVTGWHYMVDSLAGLLLGWICYRLPFRAAGLDRWRRVRRGPELKIEN